MAVLFVYEIFKKQFGCSHHKNREKSFSHFCYELEDFNFSLSQSGNSYLCICFRRSLFGNFESCSPNEVRHTNENAKPPSEAYEEPHS